jgi:signal transduction histidine kinase
MKLLKLVTTTSFKLSALYLGLFLCSFLALGVTVFLLTAHTLEQQLKNNIESEITRLNTEYETGGLAELITEINEVAASKSHLTQQYGLLDKNNQLLAGQFGCFKAVEGWQVIAVQTDKPPVTLMTRVTALPDAVWLGVGYDSAYIKDAGVAIIEAFLWGFGLVLVFGVAGGFYISHAFLKKIERITESTQAIIGGDLSHRLPVTENRDELDNLAQLLNRMLDKIGALIENVQQVSNDIAHDLRTPLSRLKFRLEDALKTSRSEAHYKGQIAAAIAEVDTLLDTFAALLRISQIESQSRRSGFKAVNFSELVASVTDALSPVAEEQGKIMTAEIAPDCPLTGDKELLTQCVFNLLENAILHTPANTPITVSLKPVDKRIELVVADNGFGISEAYRQKVFQRFYRLEQSRTTAGNGLGLSIVAAIVELHEGVITLADNTPGLKVTLVFGHNQSHTA